MQSVAIFNNKGGVGKTTLLCNLAAHLAINRSKRVLVVDADPQCNSTQNMFDDDTVDEILADDSFTIDKVIRPLAQGKGFSSDFVPRRSENFGIDVVPGDPRLSLTEDLLATDWVQATSGSTRGLRTSFVFSNLLEKCKDYDYVFFDMGPSLGSINRAVLLSSDYFIMPMSIDIFSLRAMDNIAVSVQKWKQQLTAGLDQNDEHDELEIVDPTWHLEFIGYVTQQYTAKRDSTGTRRPVKAFENLMSEIPARIQRNFLAESRLALDQANLGTIPTLHSLIPMSQMSRKPIFELKAADGVVGAHFQKVREYFEVISEIGQRFLNNVEAAES